MQPERPAESRARNLPRLRMNLASGMLFCVVTMALDTLYLQGEWLAFILSTKFIAVFCSFAAALAASSIEKLQGHLDAILTTCLLVASASLGVVAAIAAGTGHHALLSETIVVVLGIYLLSGLPLRYSAAAAMPALFALAAAGLILGTPPGFMAYAIPLLAIANALGAVCSIANEKLEQSLADSLRQLNSLQNTDRLTGIYNRQMFDDHLARVWKQSRRERHNLGLLVVDIDYMRAFNKRYGHPEGDRCIQRVGEALKSSVRRPLDFVARFDGSRFAMVLYDPPTAYIRRLVVSVQTAIAGLHIPNEGSPIGPRVTVSIGAVVLGPQTEKSLEGAVQFAEEALSASKLRGRDRAVVFQSSDLDASTNSAKASLSASA